MTRQRKNRAISVLLVVVMVLGMIPMITKAAEEPKVESSMKLEHAFDFSLISALCHSDELGAFQNYYTSYTYDKLGRVDSWEITRYQYDGRGLTTKMTDALGNVTTYTCDGDENLVSKTDADRFTTEYTYNRLDMATHINYNGGK